MITTAARWKPQQCRHAVASVALLVVLIAPAAVASSKVASAGPALLAGATSIEAKSTSTARVRVPRAASVTVKAGRTGAIALGRGRSYGVVLSRSGSTAADQVLALSRLNRCHTKACPAPGPSHSFELHTGVGFPVSTDGLAATYKIPAGDYDLTVFTDGAPVRVKLAFTGLSGATTIRPRGPASAQIEAAPDETLNGTSPYFAPPVVESPNRTDTTLLMGSLAYDMAVRSDSPSSECYYADAMPAVGRATPGCPGGISGFLFAVGGLATDFKGWSVSLTLLQKAPGVWRAGHYLVGGGTPPRGRSDFTFVDVPSL